MKVIKSLVIACVVVVFAMASVAQAGPGGCCKKAQKGGKDCTHGCCVKAAKDGKWCANCGGEGEISKLGACCAKAAKAGKDCAHKCCVESAKEGKNCSKCGGKGKIEKPAKKKDK